MSRKQLVIGGVAIMLMLCLLNFFFVNTLETERRQGLSQPSVNADLVALLATILFFFSIVCVAAGALFAPNRIRSFGNVGNKMVLKGIVPLYFVFALVLLLVGLWAFPKRL